MQGAEILGNCKGRNSQVTSSCKRDEILDQIRESEVLDQTSRLDLDRLTRFDHRAKCASCWTKEFLYCKGCWVFPLGGFSQGKSCLLFAHYDLYCSIVLVWLNF